MGQYNKFIRVTPNRNNIFFKIMFIAAMEQFDPELIKLRYGLTFRKLLDRNIEQHNRNKSNNFDDPMLVHSLGGLSSLTGLRKATLSEIFAGKTFPSGKSIFLIIEGLGSTFKIFGEYFDSITERELFLYKKDIDKESTMVSK